ncbi:uncharacterized protein I303_107086 [Kwoniella dejecticola CBS 10117]|uniref:RNase III domain-containing protein n=1 Tax=Kwoniella dejecticola CBS 10117 TaxID=1296121 RepID=A0A1A5ZYP8_9TREE|nr:uncharacterized protein I303_06487 [Kwoniella dejecticola CBS 10117]OBR82929.1 hypothetical protein I303_06487 [Kwoniella dejecticola CBS 10117]
MDHSSAEFHILELLGDRLFEVAAVKSLWESCSTVKTLDKGRQKLTTNEAFAQIAKAYKLQVKLTEASLPSMGSDTKTMADALEARMAAAYLDACRRGAEREVLSWGAELLNVDRWKGMRHCVQQSEEANKKPSRYPIHSEEDIWAATHIDSLTELARQKEESDRRASQSSLLVRRNPNRRGILERIFGLIPLSRSAENAKENSPPPTVSESKQSTCDPINVSTQDIFAALAALEKRMDALDTLLSQSMSSPSQCMSVTHARTNSHLAAVGLSKSSEFCHYEASDESDRTLGVSIPKRRKDFSPEPSGGKESDTNREPSDAEMRTVWETASMRFRSDRLPPLYRMSAVIPDDTLVEAIRRTDKADRVNSYLRLYNALITILSKHSANRIALEVAGKHLLANKTISHLAFHYKLLEGSNHVLEQWEYARFFRGYLSLLLARTEGTSAADEVNKWMESVFNTVVWPNLEGVIQSAEGNMKSTIPEKVTPKASIPDNLIEQGVAPSTSSMEGTLVQHVDSAIDHTTNEQDGSFRLIDPKLLPPLLTDPYISPEVIYRALQPELGHLVRHDMSVLARAITSCVKANDIGGSVLSHVIGHKTGRTAQQQVVYSRAFLALIGLASQQIHRQEVRSWLSALVSHDVWPQMVKLAGQFEQSKWLEISGHRIESDPHAELSDSKTTILTPTPEQSECIPSYNNAATF